MTGPDAFRWWRLPIGRGSSFPVRRKDFDLALAEIPLTSLREVLSAPQRYREPADYFSAAGIPEPHGIGGGEFTPLASATWQGIDPGRDAPSLTSRISLYAVRSERRAELHDRMAREGLPVLLRWIRELETGPATRRSEKRRLVVFLDGDRVEHAEG